MLLSAPRTAAPFTARYSNSLRSRSSVRNVPVLADPMRRPGDGALWQMDLAFAPAGSPLFASNRYA